MHGTLRVLPEPVVRQGCRRGIIRCKMGLSDKSRKGYRADQRKATDVAGRLGHQVLAGFGNGKWYSVATKLSAHR
jgi:hypothetical protein